MHREQIFLETAGISVDPRVQDFPPESGPTEHLGVKLILSYLRVSQGLKQGMEATGPPEGEFHKKKKNDIFTVLQRTFPSLNMQSHCSKYHELILVMQAGDT